MANGKDGYEIERKYLIRRPDTDLLARRPGCVHVEIVQNYLKAPKGAEIRIRQWSAGGQRLYFRTEKRGSGLTREEREERISEETYLRLLEDADRRKCPVRKDRYRLDEGGKCWEIDIYPFWKRQAVMEIELGSEEEEFSFPEGIRVIREVTDDPRYRNSFLAGR